MRFNMHADRVTSRLLIVVLVLLMMELANVSRVSAASNVAIIIYDHGVTEQLTWTKNGNFVANNTSSFTQDDRVVFAYVTAAVSSANLTWVWSNPEGQSFKNDTQQVRCDVSPCTFISYLPLAHTSAALQPGLWTVSLQAGGAILYSDHFSVTPVVTQDNYWEFDILQSAPPRVRGELMVVIHPNNGTWSSYVVRLWYAANVTAHEYASHRQLNVTTLQDTFIVDLGAPRHDGYTFVLSFDVLYSLVSLGGWDTGNFAFTWQESSWGTFNDGYHFIPGSFSVTLPQGGGIIDTVGINAIVLNQSVRAGSKPTVVFTTTLPPGLRFGWTVIYRDYTYVNSHRPNSTSGNPVTGLSMVLSQQIPVIPLSLGSLSLWAAAMAVILVTTSEFLSPLYSRTGMVTLNRRRLRIAALFLVAVFLGSVVYQVILLQSIVAQVSR